MPQRSRRLVPTVIALLCAGSLAGCGLVQRDSGTPSATTSSTAAAPRGLEKFYAQTLDWANCDGGECAELEVPVDYADPDGETLRIAVLRAPAKGTRAGSLVVNPGGPGGSGVEYARYADFIVTPKVRRAYDVVGFDPRGVGQSEPIDCLDGEQLDTFLGFDPTPDDAREKKAFARNAKTMADGCAKNGGSLTAHMSTVEAAKDMDVLRAALGEDRLDYLGKSYGTFLGATYAEQFPKNVGRFVLDGVVAPDLTSQEFTDGQAKGFELATRTWATSCVDGGSCPLGSTEDEVVAELQRILKVLDKEPIEVDGIRLGEGWATLGVGAALYDQSKWKSLTEALVDARDGEGRALMALANLYADRTGNGEYRGNIMEAIYAVNCLDRQESSDPADYDTAAAKAEKVAPVWGEFIARSSMSCGYWPVKATGTPHPIDAKGAAPIVLVGTTRDPATPYEWATRVHEQMPDSRLITFEGDGHTAYTRSNDCVDGAVDAYLLDGTLPDEDLRC